MTRRAKVSQEDKKIIDAIRKEWMSDKEKHKAIQRCAEKVDLQDGRKPKTRIRCQCCQGLFRREEIEANHINPVGPLKSTKPEDVAEYRRRMFCRYYDLEPLCKPCHRKKTNAHRRQQRKEQECTSENLAIAPQSTTTKPKQIVLSVGSNSF